MKWLIPSLLFILIFAMAARTPLDTDLWWHLRAGEATWNSRQPVLVDQTSFTRAGAPWTNHSWLAQIALYLLFQWGGFLAISGLIALAAAFSMFLVYRQMDGAPLMRAFILVLAAAVAAPVWSARPQIFTLVLFSGLAYLLNMYKWQKKNLLWICIPLFILWSNLHGGYALGLILFALTIAGESLNKILNQDAPNTLSWNEIGGLVVWSFISWGVVAINPNGIEMWVIPFKTVGVGVLRSAIEEWSSPDFHQLSQQPFIWMLFGAFGAIIFSRRRPEAGDFVLIAGFAYLGLLARRNFGPFAIAGAPVMARYLSALHLDSIRLPDKLRIKSQVTLPKKVAIGINVALLGLTGLAALIKLLAVSAPAFVSEIYAQEFPIEAVQWINSNQPPGKIFNAYQWGGFLTWELRKYPVFVDGRTDLYGEELLRAYIRIHNGDFGWEEEMNRYEMNLVLVEAESGLAKVLGYDLDWKERYKDDLAVIFTREE
jgi:hypothetical protein